MFAAGRTQDCHDSAMENAIQIVRFGHVCGQSLERGVIFRPMAQAVAALQFEKGDVPSAVRPAGHRRSSD